MNREDPAKHPRQYQNLIQNRRHNHTDQFRPFHYEQRSWIDNQHRKPFIHFPRSGGWQKSIQHPPGWQKFRRQGGPCFPRPVPAPIVPQPPTPEEIFQSTVQRKSQYIQKQLQESPNAEVVLPPLNSMDNTTNEDNNENNLPGITYLEEAVDSTVAVLNREKVAKKQKQIDHEHERRAMQIVQSIRKLKLKERLKVSRELRDVCNKGRNIAECDNINAISSYFSVDIDDLPEEVREKISNELNVDLGPLPEDSKNTSVVNLAYDDDEINSNAPGNMPYDPFELEPNCVTPMFDLPTQLQTQFKEDEEKGTSMADDSWDNALITRSVKCHVRSGRPDAEVPRFKIKREVLSDDSNASIDSISQPVFSPVRNESSSETTKPQTPPPPKISHGTHSMDEVVNVISKIDLSPPRSANDLSNKDEKDGITLRKCLKMGSPENSEWERNIEVKCKKHVLREYEQEAEIRAKLSSSVKLLEEDTQVEILQNGKDEEEFEEKIISHDSESGSLQKQILLTDDYKSEVVDYEPESGEDNDGDSQSEECSEQVVDIEKKSFIEPVVQACNQNIIESAKDCTKVKPDGTPVLVFEATCKPGAYKFKQGKLVNESSSKTPTEIPTDIPKPKEVSEGIQTDDLAGNIPIVEEKGPNSEIFKSDSIHKNSVKSDRKRKHSSSSKSSSSRKHSSSTTISSSSKSKFAKGSKSKSSSTTKLATPIQNSSLRPKSEDKRKSRSSSRSKQIKTVNCGVQTDPERTSEGKLREKYFRLKQNTRAMLRKMNSFERQLENLLTKRREIYKAFEAFASTSESEEEITVPEETPRHHPDSHNKKNPVLNSAKPSEQILTQVLHNDAEKNPNPASPTDFLAHSVDLDIFSVISESQEKVSFTQPETSEGLETQDETFAEDSNPVAEAPSTEIELDTDLGGVLNISETLPTDYLEPSDNESFMEPIIRNPIVRLIKCDSQIPREQLDLMRSSESPFATNCVKIEDASGMDDDYYYDSHQKAVDFIAWKDSILVIKIVKNMIVAGDGQGHIYYYDPQSPFPIITMKLSSQSLTSISVNESTNGIRLYIGSTDCNLYVYDFETKSILRVAHVAAPIQCIDLKWMTLYLGSSRGELIKYSLTNGRVSAPVKISEESVLAVKCATEGGRRILLIATRNAPVTVRDAATGLELRTIGGACCATVYSLVLHNSRIYCGTSQNDVVVYNFHDGQFLFKHGESGGSGIVCMTSVQNILFVAGYNGRIYVYNITDNIFIASISGPCGLLLSMAIVNRKLIIGTKQKFQIMALPESVASLL